jgi:hypothetical protein
MSDILEGGISEEMRIVKTVLEQGGRGGSSAASTKGGFCCSRSAFQSVFQEMTSLLNVYASNQNALSFAYGMHACH